MAAITRVGDTTEGICDNNLKCCPHPRSGTNQTGSPDIFIEGMPVHRIDDKGATNCPHGGQFISVAGAGNIFANGKQIALVGDKTICTNCGKEGIHKTGAASVFIGG